MILILFNFVYTLSFSFLLLIVILCRLLLPCQESEAIIHFLNLVLSWARRFLSVVSGSVYSSRALTLPFFPSFVLTSFLHGSYPILSLSPRLIPVETVPWWSYVFVIQEYPLTRLWSAFMFSNQGSVSCPI